MKGASNEPSALPEAHWRRNSGGRPMHKLRGSREQWPKACQSYGIEESRPSFAEMILDDGFEDNSPALEPRTLSQHNSSPPE